jgi:hypothetical protein
MSLSLLQPFKEAIPLFTFTFGDSVIYATTWKSPVPFQGNVYKPEPAIECRLPRQGGSVSEEACVIELPTERSVVHPELSSMANLMASPRAIPRTRVRVALLLISGQLQKVVYPYEGKLEKVTRNPDGKKSVVRVEFLSELASGLENASLGRRCDPECDLLFGKAGCWVDNSLFFNPANGSAPSSGDTLAHYSKVRRAKVIASFVAPYTSRQVSLLLDTTAAEHAGMGVAPYAALAQTCISQQPQDWWVRSYLSKGGLRISIQEWKQSSALFTLNRLPPTSWDGAQLELVIDCPKTSTACAARGNTQFFGGIGVGIPAYNPTIDLPNSG